MEIPRLQTAITEDYSHNHDHNDLSTAALRLDLFHHSNHNYDYTDETNALLSPTQPIPPPIAEPPSSYEKRIVAHYRTLRARIHDGPFYTVLDSSARISKTGQRSPPAAHFDPFDGRPTYSQRFVRKRNTLPRLSTRPFGE